MNVQSINVGEIKMLIIRKVKVKNERYKNVYMHKRYYELKKR